jgi:hypothetical protein
VVWQMKIKKCDGMEMMQNKRIEWNIILYYLETLFLEGMH